MRNFFTLIELIVVIAVLGILAAIIIPNISSFQEEANETAIQSNVRNLQTSVDMYGLENHGAVPTADIPLEDVPQPIDFNKIYPDYTRDIPETEGVKYWVDFQGKVWASTIDSPTNVSYNPGTLEWAGIEEAAYYNIFKVVNNSSSGSIKNKKTIFIKKLEDSSETVTDNTLPNLKTGEQYLVNAVDDKGFESAPVGTNYTGYVEVPFVSGQSVDALVPIGTSYIFTNAGATSSYGPNQSQLDSAYTNSNLEGKVTSSNGIQLWTVPETGSYRIETYGAAGGNNSLYTGGKGAIMTGNFSLTEGQNLKILVGQRGNTNANHCDAGGGGGTYVTQSDNTPLIISGGGGGSSHLSAGKSAVVSTSGTNGNGTGAAGGTNGYGGNALTNNGGPGGGGLLGNGTNTSWSSGGYSGYGRAFVNGGQGGRSPYAESLNYSANGGFGGGGSGHGNCYTGTGGGGGYSGGGGGQPGYGGGGGGSVNSGTNQNNSVGNTTEGKVIITKVN